MSQTIQEIIARWDSGEGKPYKGSLIDQEAYKADPSIGCMCAQGQVLHLVAGWEPERLADTAQSEADAETAKLLNISRAHAILLRIVNDKVGGAPSIVLTDPGKVLGDQWSKLLDFWWMMHCYDDAAWKKVDAAWAGARITAEAAARIAARIAAAGAAAAGTAVLAAAGAAVLAAAGAAAGDAALEIQGFELLKQRGQDVFFLPMFGIKTLDDIPARPADYGLGLITKEPNH